MLFRSDAACYYGQGTRWCTAATRGKNYFSEYHNESPLLIILPKEPQYPGEKYQLHFIVTLGDHMTIRNNRDEEDMWANYSENYIIDKTKVAIHPDGGVSSDIICP